MDSKAIVKVGTFIKKLYTTNPTFSYLRDEFCLDAYTEPDYVCKIVRENLAPEEVVEIAEQVKKTNLKEYVDVLFQEKYAG
ncbi:MAG: hypothetical protein WC511_02900 [Candidatus Pacearchaeota archaeon]